MFALQNVPSRDDALAALDLEPLTFGSQLTHEGGRYIEDDAEVSRFDLTLSMQEREQGIVGVFEYNTDLFYADTIARMAENYKRLLQALMEEPTQSISAIDYLSDLERDIQRAIPRVTADARATSMTPSLPYRFTARNVQSTTYASMATRAFSWCVKGRWCHLGVGATYIHPMQTYPRIGRIILAPTR